MTTEPPPPAESSPLAAPKKSDWGIRIFLALVTLGFAAAGVAGIKTYFDQSSEHARLEEEGIEVQAEVLSATEYRTRRSRYFELSVSYDPGGPDFLAFATVQDCNNARYETGTRRVEIVYLAEDPEVVQLVACRGNFDATVFPGIIGVVFLGLALLMVWKVRWRD